MSSITQEIVYTPKHVKKLIVFLHGYIDCADSIADKINFLIENSKDTAIHIPQAPFTCEIHGFKRQWYSMHKYDTDDARRSVINMEEYIKIYDTMKSGASHGFKYLNRYINKLLKQYNLHSKDAFICGFSQGASLAMYTALQRKEKLAGCISFSGMMVAPSHIISANSTPDFLLIHGNQDNLVRYSAMDWTKKYLQGKGCKVITKTLRNGKHRLCTQGLQYALNFINARL